jgi:hypothetical protein
MTYLRTLAEQVEPDARLTSVRVRPEQLPTLFFCSAVPQPGACLPDDVEDTLSRIRSAIRAVSVSVTAPSVEWPEPEVRWAMGFAARDEEDAQDVLRDLEELLRDWRAHLENREAGFIETIRERDAAGADKDEALLRAFVRAMGSARIERRGTVAWLVAEDRLTDAEQREVNASLEAERADREAASRIVLALTAGGQPERQDLVTLLGEANADWFRTPRATSAQCASVRGHLASLSGPGLPTQDFGAVYRLNERLADDACVGRAMPASYLACLTEAATAVDMEACPMPQPPPPERD